MTQTLAVSALADFGARLLTAAGVPPSNAAFVAESLVAANLRGIDSHGIHLLSYYLKHLAAGTLDPAATGLLMIGGGVPKNFAQDTVVCAEILGHHDVEEAHPIESPQAAQQA